MLEQFFTLRIHTIYHTYFAFCCFNHKKIWCIKDMFTNTKQVLFLENTRLLKLTLQARNAQRHQPCLRYILLISAGTLASQPQWCNTTNCAFSAFVENTMNTFWFYFGTLVLKTNLHINLIKKRTVVKWNYWNYEFDHRKDHRKTEGQPNKKEQMITSGGFSFKF